MKEIVALVGRTNVGKSLLFNKLTKSRKSLVIDHHGVTRDINSGYLFINNKRMYVEDTGGIPNKEDEFSSAILTKITNSIDNSSVVLFVVSASDGLTNQDYNISKMLRKLNKEVLLVINKSDLTKKSQSIEDFYKLGFKNTLLVSAKNNNGISDLIKKISEFIKGGNVKKIQSTRRVSIVGKPNSGKSTLINTMLNEDRMITSEIAGTTIDSIELPFSFKGNDYLLYDTAGLTRKSKTISTIQKFSISATLETIKNTDICLFIISAEDGITKQDKLIINIIKKYNKPFIVAVNKIDKQSKHEIMDLKKEIKYFSNITDNAYFILISAIENKNIKKLLYSIKNIASSIYKRFKASKLTEILEDALNNHPPPMINSKRIRLKFAQQSKSDSLLINIFGTKTDKLPPSYEKYLMGYFIDKLKLKGIPLKIKLSKQKNPFSD